MNLKSILHIIIIICVISSLSAQNNNKSLPKLYHSGAFSKLSVPMEAKVSKDLFFNEYKEVYQLVDGNQMILLDELADNQGDNHLSYQQYFNGIPILGAIYKLHERNQLIYKANGVLHPNFSMHIEPVITKEEALSIALDYIKAESYMWEIDVQHDEYAPVVTLCIVDSEYPLHSGNFSLAYKMDVHCAVPLKRERIYIDALSGDVIKSYDILTHCFGEGPAETLYHGTQFVQTSQEGDDFLLYDKTRGSGIITRDVKGTIFTDKDNYWEKNSLVQRTGGLDVHWGSVQVYDFLLEKFGRKSLNNFDLPILSIIIDTGSYNNAFWNGVAATYGIGDRQTYNPFTSIDVVAHELTHGLTEFSASLEYQYESGAMNEAFSDIFGKAVEYKSDPGQFNWFLGQKIMVNKNSALRDMSNPHRFRHPKYYKGAYWLNNTSDNGGVHTNSGVLNHWFYLLVEGGAGKNEGNRDFVVQAMGMDTAILIAYKILTEYLTPTSSYFQAREASMDVAEQLFGLCSPSYKNIAEAWKAVGIGTGIQERDAGLSNNTLTTRVCKEGFFNLEVRLDNNGCTEPIPSGTEILFTYQVESNAKIIEVLTLDQDLAPGATLLYTFLQDVYLEKNGNNRVYVDVFFESDADTSNNRFTVTLSKSTTTSDHDFRMDKLNVFTSSCPEKMNNRISAEAIYNGCTIIPKQSNLEFRIQLGTEVIIIPFKNKNSIYPSGKLVIPTFQIPRNFIGLKKATASIVWIKDTVASNNSFSFVVVFLNYSTLGYHEGFDNNQFDSSLLQVHVDSFNSVGFLEENGNSSLLITGGNIFTKENKFIPSKSNSIPGMFLNNPKFSSTIYLCANVTNENFPKLEFDLAQVVGNTNYDSLQITPKASPSTRLILRDSFGTNIYSSYISDAETELNSKHYVFDLPTNTTSLAIELINLCLEGGIDSLGQIDLTKDYLLFDNIRITSSPVKANDIITHNYIISPNPVANYFTISTKFSNQRIPDSQVKIFNQQGIKVYEKGIKNVGNSYRCEADLLPGYYILILEDPSGQRFIQSLIK
ncbi:MAG: M4 family metallopeptidase [Bacteroidota bacterium]|nr:M4 family metallopeptidase [Bacteroidota bacterium]